MLTIVDDDPGGHRQRELSDERAVCTPRLKLYRSIDRCGDGRKDVFAWIRENVGGDFGNSRPVDCALSSHFRWDFILVEEEYLRNDLERAHCNVVLSSSLLSS